MMEAGALGAGARITHACKRSTQFPPIYAQMQKTPQLSSFAVEGTRETGNEPQDCKG